MDQSRQDKGPVDCHPTLPQSYRAELIGIMATYFIIHCLVKITKIYLTTQITAHVDNSAAVAVNNMDPHPPLLAVYTSSGIYIVQEIWAMKDNGLNIKTQWVEAHQYTKYTCQGLILPSTLN
eukprot:3993443-Ditylum_brightwellii.AAC.1